MKTYISFMVRVRFAGAYVQQRALRVRLETLGELGPSPRIARVERYGEVVATFVRITEPAALDDELAGWVADAYAVGARGFARR